MDNENRKASFEPRSRYCCCHPNPKGTGSSVRFEMHPAHGYSEGSIFVTFAAQKTVGSSGEGEKTLPTFDWEGGVTVRLSINEVAEVLEVFRGYRERLGDGKGFYHTTMGASTLITLAHRLEPSPGYTFGVSRKMVDGSVRRVGILLSMTESIVLSEAMASSLVYMAFGIPKVYERAERSAAKARHGSGSEMKEVA